jgi:hypothetical protein
MLATLPLSALAMTWRAILNSEDRYIVAAVANVATPLVSIFFLLQFGRDWGVHALAAGTLIGSAIETLILAVAVERPPLPIWPRWSGRTPELNLVLAQYAPLVAGTLLLGGAPLIDQAIAATLGSGNVAAFQYGTRLFAVLGAIGPAAVATAILPHFSRLIAADESRAARRSLRGYASLILAVTIPVVALLIIFSPLLIRVIFERGQFTGTDTALVALVQRCSLLALPFSMLLALGLNIVQWPVSRASWWGYRFYHKTAVHPLGYRPARLAPAGWYLLGLPLHIKTLPGYRLSSAIIAWYKSGTYGCFCEFFTMARNTVQFQKGLSEAQFAVLYGTEDLCRQVVTRWRWPSGFTCPVCGGNHHSFVKTRALYQCTACRRQTSLIAGTIFAATKVPLCIWFRAMYHLTQQGRYLQHRVGPPARRYPDHGLEDQAQAHAGNDGAGCRKAPDRTDRDRRHLSRRRA